VHIIVYINHQFPFSAGFLFILKPPINLSEAELAFLLSTYREKSCPDWIQWEFCHSCQWLQCFTHS